MKPSFQMALVLKSLSITKKKVRCGQYFTCWGITIDSQDLDGMGGNEDSRDMGSPKGLAKARTCSHEGESLCDTVTAPQKVSLDF